MKNNKIVETFVKLVEIDSVSRNEAQVHAHLKETFTNLGLEIVEDQSMAQTGLGANNLVVKLKGTDPTKQPIFFSCHTDTVAPGNGIEVIEKEGILYSKGETILGADDKAGIAILIEAIKEIQEQQIPTGDLEFVFSPGEEIGLIGAAALDMNLIDAELGYVLDSGGPVGHVTIASPTLYMYEVQITGKSAHSGVEPEKGVSAVAILGEALTKIEMGRIDEMTTANIGVIQGGKATNVVMDNLLVKGEVRAVMPEVAEQLIHEAKEAFEKAAAKFGGSVEIKIDKMATGFHITEEQPVMQVLTQALEELAFDLVPEVSGGGSDANIFNAKGKAVVNLSIGYEEIHTVNEYIPIEEMLRAQQLVVELAKLAPVKNAQPT